jgi:3-dehydroquinate synthase
MKMKPIIFKAGSVKDGYKVYLGSGLGDFPLDDFLGSKIFIVTDKNVYGALAKRMGEYFRKFDYPLYASDYFVLPPGEKAKSEKNLRKIYAAMLKRGMNRSGTLIALGGGVIGDIAGFAAATYMRGVNLVHFPSTLLAMVDSSIGGKTGINLPEGKNLVGSFYRPKAVLSDLSFLGSLPPREFAAGMAEIVKVALIKNRPLLKKIHAYYDAPKKQKPHLLEELVSSAIKIKRTIVENDELETGERMLLNFGHSFGHAIEAKTKYASYLHGEAVAIGMVIAAELSEAAGFIGKKDCETITDLLRKIGLPAQNPFELPKLLPYLTRDKKSAAEGLNFVFLKRIGEAKIARVTLANTGKPLPFKFL